ncbi:MAG: hypothetical protein SGJ24_17995 [Chloroflexota bacterium]|nr:hypothetical protein [Chloroflexota bacterium]
MAAQLVIMAVMHAQYHESPPMTTNTHTQRCAAKAEMRAVLIQCARDRHTITYGDLCIEITAMRLFPRSRVLVALLNEIGAEDEANGLPALATLVVRKADGRPGGGYFRGSGMSEGDAEAYWQEQFARVCAAWAMSSQ